MESILEGALQKANSKDLKGILLNKDDGGDKRPAPEPSSSTSSSSPNKRHQKDDDAANDGVVIINRYNGWTVPSNHYTIETIDIDDTVVTPESFYKNYIRLRKPVVIRGGSLEKVVGNTSNKLEQWKSIEYLKSKAGESTVMVEQRSSTNDSFGRGNETCMKFSNLLDLIVKGDDRHYLTTQDVEADNEDGRPDLMAPFMKQFTGDFPLRPPLMGNLVPQNINVWMGNNSDGTSSGLHHDYHDNLYIVLKGKKRFRLFSPIDAQNMYTRGQLLQVHENGRINYKGQETTAYGSDLKSDAAATASMRNEQAEAMLAQAEQDVQNGVEGAQERLEAAESAMEDALEALLDAEIDDDEGDDAEDDGTGGLFSSSRVNFDENSDNDDDKGDGDDNDDDIKSDKADDETSEQDCKPSSNATTTMSSSRRLVDKTVKNPDNFSRVPFNVLDDDKELSKTYPNILNAKSAFCTVQEGETLYLPASWFHEVTSFGGECGGHLAMNYWFHPPDAIDNYDQPYTTNFWTNDFEQRFASTSKP